MQQEADMEIEEGHLFGATTMKSPVILLGASLLAAFPIACVAAALWYILHWNDTNHGIDFLPTLWPLSVCLLFAAYKYFRGKKRAYVVPLCANVMAIMFFVGVDRFNIMLDYDVWAGTGMPGPFEKRVEQPKNKGHKPVYTKEEIEEMNRGTIKVYDERGLLMQISPSEPAQQNEPSPGE
jgi:hypothetical protein